MKLGMQQTCCAGAERLRHKTKPTSRTATKRLLAKPGSLQAELIFDSACQAPGAGVRSGAISARQLLYRSGSVCIDMHIQPKLGSISALLTGQLLDSGRQNRAMQNVPVSLLCDGDMISHQKTNAGGEFDFGVDTMQQLQLAFGIGKHRMVVVAVPRVQLEPSLQSR
jgi:hypothetical protein